MNTEGAEYKINIGSCCSAMTEGARLHLSVYEC